MLLQQIFPDFTFDPDLPAQHYIPRYCDTTVLEYVPGTDDDEKTGEDDGSRKPSWKVLYTDLKTLSVSTA